LFVPKTERVAYFVADRPAIPTVLPELEELFAPSHSDRGEKPPSPGLYFLAP
jgi:hypothetical protein